MRGCTGLIGAAVVWGVAANSAYAEKPTVAVEVLEGFPDDGKFDLAGAAVTGRYSEPAFAFARVPAKYSDRGIVLDRSIPFALRAAATLDLPGGEHRVLLRTRNAARVFIDGKLVAESPPLKLGINGHEPVRPIPPPAEPSMPPLKTWQVEKVVRVKLDAGKHAFRCEILVGGKKLRPETGEPLVALALPGKDFHLLSPGASVPFTSEAWTDYARTAEVRHPERDDAARRAASAGEAVFWKKRHDLSRAEWKDRPSPAVPDGADANPIDRFLGQALDKAKRKPRPVVDDHTFLRRVYLDTVGVPPTPEEVDAFRKDDRADRRDRLVEKLLADERWADHWTSYWQDVLGENPGLLKPTLNNTGPFRFWINAALRDNLPMDRFVTELVRMEGSTTLGAPAGFGVATENDVPMAAKAIVLSRAFLAIDMQCARCHDAPGSAGWQQKQLFHLAAMLGQGPLKVPATSSARLDTVGRKPLVKVTLKAGTSVEPDWPVAAVAPGEVMDGLLPDKDTPRERFAALLTSPRNERFARVLANRVWHRLMGYGLVEPVDDWGKGRAGSHPDLLAWLACELVTHDYDLQYLNSLVLTSRAYQREAAALAEGDPAEARFAGPARRRLSAEQVLDSLFAVAGKDFTCEELTFDPEGRMPVNQCLNFGFPRRAWELIGLANERDRPALALPAAQGLVDVLQAYGWREARSNSLTVRDDTVTPLGPMVLANGQVGGRVTRLSDDSAFTTLALADRPLTALIDRVVLRVLSRLPTSDEKAAIEEVLSEGYANRKVDAPLTRKAFRPRQVSWSNHLDPESTRLKLDAEKDVRAGDPATRRLRPEWRGRMEDVVWSLLNTPEFVFVP